ncbi:hypothetical protein RB595_000910 [Gaeumannomyces hyphopodioides]
MKLATLGAWLGAYAATATALADAAPRTIHLCGDSTMAPNGGGRNTQGWGEFLHHSFSPAAYVVNNAAVAGRSARSFTREGRFDAVAGRVKPGDWVVIEFGHNDGGSLANDNGRSACFGAGSETCRTTYNGVSETVQTYPTYLKRASSMMLKAGAKVILAPLTPNNPWESGSFAWGPSRFDYYAWLAASELGGPSAGVWFVPHGHLGAQAMRNLGRQTVNAGFPNDHTHTSPYMADIMAKSFVLGLRCGTSPLGKDVLNSTESLTGTFLGPCITFNSTVPVKL